MSRLPHLLLTSVLALAAPAAVMAAPPGVNLRWDSCLSDGGVINKTFACDTNNGSERLVLSFVLDTQLADVSGMEIRVFIASATPTLPSWWSMKNAGTCRPTSLGLTGTLPPGAVNCVDWANGLAAGGLSSYNIGFFGPNTVFISGALAVPATALAVLGADQEYFAANLTINHAKTVGTACTGCNEPVCIVFDRLRLDTPVIANDRTLQGGANGPDSQFARWQNAAETNVQIVNCDGANLGCLTQFSCVLTTPTGTRGSTWGSVKALYR